MKNNQALIIESLDKKRHLLNPEQQKILQSLKKRRSSRSLDSDRISQIKERDILDRSFIEGQLPKGGELKDPESTNIPFFKDVGNFGVLRKISQFEDDETALGYLDEKLPEDQAGILIKTRQGERIPGYIKEGDPNVYRLNEEGFSISDLAPITSVPTNIEDIMGTAAAMSPIGKGGTVAASGLKRMLAESIGSAIGRAADEVIDNQFYGQEDDLNKILAESAQSGVLGGLSSKLSDFGEGVVNHYRQARSNIPLKKSEFGKAADVLGAPKPTMAEETKDPFWKRIESIYQGLTTKGAEFREKRQQATTNAITKEVKKAVKAGEIDITEDGILDYRKIASNLSDEALFNAQRDMQNQTTRTLRKILFRKGIRAKTTKESGGQAVLKGIYGNGGYNDIKSAAIEKQYQKAFDTANEEGAIFNLSSLKEKLSDVSKKPFLVGTDGQKIEFSNIDNIELLNTIDQLKKVSEDQSRPVISEGQPAFEKISGIRDAGPKQIIESQRDPSQVAQDLIQIRSKLFDLSQPNRETGLHDVNSRAASILHGVLTESLGNSTSGKGFAKEWTKANQLYKERLNILEAFEVAKFDDPLVVGRGEQAYKTIKGRMTDAHIRTLKTILPEKEFDKFKSSYHEELLSDPFSLESKLKSLTPAERALLPNEAQKIMSLYAKKLSRIGHGDIAKMFNNTSSSIERAKTVFRDTPADQVDQVLGRLGISKNTYRASMMSDFFRNTTEFVDGKFVTKPGRFTKEVTKLKESGHFANLSPVQKQILNSANVYESYLKGMGANLATSLEQMTILANKADFTRPIQMTRAKLDTMRYNILGTISHNSEILRRVKQGFEERKSIPKLRGMVSILIDTIDKLEDNTDRDLRG